MQQSGWGLEFKVCMCSVRKCGKEIWHSGELKQKLIEKSCKIGYNQSF